MPRGVIPIAERYSSFAPFYDVLSAEFPVYRAGRRLGIQALDVGPGDQVLDIGCGTGLNFGLLEGRVGAAGTIVGIDRSPRMLAQARRKADRHGWLNIILIQADATTMSAPAVRTSIAAQGGKALSDATLATYALSLMTPWEEAWDAMKQLTRPAGSLCVVDMQDPVTRVPGLTALARLACRMGGADITAHPWQGVERDCADVVAISARRGHLQGRTGRLPSP